MAIDVCSPTETTKRKIRRIMSKLKKADWAYQGNWVSSEADTFVFTPNPHASHLSITDNAAEPIMTIQNNGEVIWHKPHQAGDAADVFCDQIRIRIEDEAGLKQNRKEWEERILDAMKKHAEIEPLTPEVLTDVFKKCIMIDKLKGIK